jgi:hypothetical protein
MRISMFRAGAYVTDDHLPHIHRELDRDFGPGSWTLSKVQAITTDNGIKLLVDAEPRAAGALGYETK